LCAGQYSHCMRGSTLSARKAVQSLRARQYVYCQSPPATAAVVEASQVFGLHASLPAGLLNIRSHALFNLYPPFATPSPAGLTQGVGLLKHCTWPRTSGARVATPSSSRSCSKHLMTCAVQPVLTVPKMPLSHPHPAGLDAGSGTCDAAEIDEMHCCACPQHNASCPAHGLQGWTQPLQVAA
jgi:hypothetical protein